MSHKNSKNDNIQQYVQCPHCEDFIEINQINCAIFRHGTLKSNGHQIPPHLPKVQCDDLIKQNLIFGCGKPFRVNIEDGKLIAIICDYV